MEKNKLVEMMKENLKYLFGTPQRTLITLIITLILFAVTNIDDSKNFISRVRELANEFFQLILTIVIMIAAMMFIIRKGILK